MWDPLVQICASPSQLLFPYVSAHTSIVPLAGLHSLGLVPPAT